MDNPGIGFLPPSPVLIAFIGALIAIVAIVFFTVTLIRTRFTGFAFGLAIAAVLSIIGGGIYAAVQFRDARGADIAKWVWQQHSIELKSGEALALLEGGDLGVIFRGEEVRVEFAKQAGGDLIAVYRVGDSKPLEFVPPEVIIVPVEMEVAPGG